MYEPLGLPPHRLPHTEYSGASDSGRLQALIPVDPGLGGGLLGWTARPTNLQVESVHGVAERLGSSFDARVLIVDDCTLYRDCLVGLFSTQNGGLKPCVAEDLASMVAELEVAQPQIMLLNMATRDSASLLRRAVAMAPQARVIVLGVAEEDEAGIVSCAEAGAAGYHMRTESFHELVVLIHKVAAGESFCSPGVSAILLKRLSSLAAQRRPAAKELDLTGREMQILRMLQTGLSNREIAEQLCIAVHTVKNHVHSLLTKLGVGSREQAAALARANFATTDFIPR
jgi:DNA-binding NarL/FixJ family response regulator